MPADPKLVELIANSRRLTKEEVFTFLKQAGYASEDIADSYNAAAIKQRISLNRRNQPWQPAVLSLLVPGAGHIYTGSVRTGLMLLGSYALAWWLTFTIIGTPVGALVLLGIIAWAVVGSYLLAQARSRS